MKINYIYYLTFQSDHFFEMKTVETKTGVDIKQKKKNTEKHQKLIVICNNDI